MKDDRESSLVRVDDIDFNSLPQRVFDCGSIEIRTLGSELVHLDKVANPRALKRAVNEARACYVDMPLASLEQKPQP